MPIKNTRRCLLPPCLLIVVAICVTAAQKGSITRMKKTWSPPDNSFTIELPVNLREINGEYDDENKERFRSIKLFGSSEAEASLGVFEIVILDLSKKEQLNVNDKLKGLEFLIGRDDQRPTKEAVVRVEGLPAREVLFVGPGKCSKGLMIDAGDRIYVLGLVVNVCEDLDTASAKRFFKTFHLKRHKERPHRSLLRSFGGAFVPRASR